MTPLVSVVVAAFNHAPFVEAMARSVLAQTVRDLELVVVDDGSLDETLAILVRVSKTDPRMRVLQHPRGGHRGRHESLVLAASQVRGRYVGVLGSDDRWAPTKLEAQLPALEEGAALSYGLARRIGPTDEVLPEPMGLAPEDAGQSPLEGMLIGNYVPALTAMFPRALYERAGGFKPDQPYEDLDLWLRLLCLGPLHFVPEPLGDYRVVPSSVDVRILDAGEDVKFQLTAIAHLSSWTGLPEQHRAEVRSWERCYRALVGLIHDDAIDHLDAILPDDADRLGRLLEHKVTRIRALVDLPTLRRWIDRVRRLGSEFREAVDPRLELLGIGPGDRASSTREREPQPAGRRSGTDPLLGAFDEPAESELVPRGTVALRGWVIDPQGPVRGLRIAVNGAVRSEAALGLPRLDVAAVHPEHPRARVSGWSAEVDLGEVPSDRVEITVTAERASGEEVELGRKTVQVAPPRD